MSTKEKMRLDSMWGETNETKLVLHIKKAQNYGFAMTVTDVRKVAKNFAESLITDHKFDKEESSDSFRSILINHHDLSVREAKGVSLAPRESMNHVEGTTLSFIEYD